MASSMTDSYRTKGPAEPALADQYRANSGDGNDADAERAAAAAEATNRRTAAFLVAGFSCWMFGAQLTRASQIEILLKTFKGDTVEMAAISGSIGTLSAVIGIFVNPIVGSLADAYGRRSVMLLGAFFSVLRPVCWLISPNVTGFVIAETVRFPTGNGLFWAVLPPFGLNLT